MRRRIMCGLVAMVLCSGQMCGVLPTFNRLAVNDTLRAACYPFGMADANIESFLTLAETDRLAGVSKFQQIILLPQVCAGDSPDLTNRCLTCSTAIFDQVYGE